MPDSRPTIDTTPLHAWLVEAGLSGMPVAALLDGFCRRLAESGIPLSRGYLSTAALHPLLWATGTTWQDGRIVEAIDITPGFETREAWRASPFRHMLETEASRLHRRLTGPHALVDFPVLHEFRDAGLTEWLALFFGFGWALEHRQVGELGVIFSWATNRAGGWSATELATIESLSAALALSVKASGGLAATRDLLATYLGHDAAQRVIAGHVQRGSIGRHAAFILYADLRGFTDFADIAAPEEVTRRLNLCFDCMGEPVKAAGGEILKFLGDGLLAVFLPGPDRGTAAVASAVLDAALEVLNRIDALNATEVAAGNPALAVDIALHQGEVTYGNVGTADRLDFTVIGPAVNEATRLEALCKELGLNLLVSDSFVGAAPGLRGQLRPLGRHRLRGVREAREIFTRA